MKKVLLASTMLVGFAGMAAADVTLSGSGRMGLVYFDDGVDDDTTLSYRMRVNIDASTETDGGIVFGGRIRLQYDNGDSHVDYNGAVVVGSSAELNAAMLYAESSGFRVEVGNVNTAFDSLATLYNAELGFISSTTGSYSRFSYDSYSSGPYINSPDRVGLFASYAAGSLVARISLIDYDQNDVFLTGVEQEVGVSVDYTAGSFKLGAGYVQNATGVEDYDVYALLGEYALSDTTNVGLQFIGENGAEEDQTITLYGNTKLGNGVGIGAFVTALDTDEVGLEDDFAVGLGASYDLGGATLAGTIQKGYDDDTYADLGINFSF